MASISDSSISAFYAEITEAKMEAKHQDHPNFSMKSRIHIKIERVIKKVECHPLKSLPQFWQFWTLDDCNVGCWADGTNPIINFESWALGLSFPIKNKKKIFFCFCIKKCHFSKFCMLINYRGGLKYPKPDYLTRDWLFFWYLSLTWTWLLAICTWLEPDYDIWQIVVK